MSGPKKSIPSRWNGHDAITGVSVHGSGVLARDAGDVWQLSGAGHCSFAGTVGIFLTNRKMKPRGTVL